MTRESNLTMGRRPWYAMISLLLVIPLLFPWFNGIAPATSPLRFFNILPFPIGNVLFAVYLGTILLNLWMAVYQTHQQRPAWYRFWLAVSSMIVLLLMADMAGLAFGWGAGGAWIVLAIAAYAELVYLFSR